MLDEMIVPFNPSVDITKCKATVHLSVRDSDIWGPSEHDEKWNASKKEMAEVFG